jgi:hypothetical protein
MPSGQRAHAQPVAAEDQPAELNRVADHLPFSSSLKGCVAIREPFLDVIV